jgi:hypothetical protein
MKVLVLTTAHWDGDPRLNRHRRYLEHAGFQSELRSLATGHRPSRLKGVFEAARIIWSDRPDIVILPDPELFVPGSLVARARGVYPVIDIHEDFAKAVASRDWIPSWLRPIARLSARFNEGIARRLAGAVVVAAPEISSRDDIVVANVPDPSTMSYSGPRHPPAVVYVGDITMARGALEMAALARTIPECRFVLIGPVDDDLKRQMVERAGSEAQLELTGRLPHGEAWRRADGAVAGLSLLRPLPAYLDATATKLWEYCAAGITPVVTRLPGQVHFVAKLDQGLAAASVDGLALIIRRLVDDADWSKTLSLRARDLAERAWYEERPDIQLVRAVSPVR